MMKVRRRSLSKPLCQLRRSNPPRSRSCFVFSSSLIRNLITLCDFVTLLSDKDEFNFYAVNSLGRKGISWQRSIKTQVKPNQIAVKDKTNSSMNQTIDADYQRNVASTGTCRHAPSHSIVQFRSKMLIQNEISQNLECSKHYSPSRVRSFKRSSRFACTNENFNIIRFQYSQILKSKPYKPCTVHITNSVQIA